MAEGDARGEDGLARLDGMRRLRLILARVKAGCMNVSNGTDGSGRVWLGEMGWDVEKSDAPVAPSSKCDPLQNHLLKRRRLLCADDWVGVRGKGCV